MIIKRIWAVFFSATGTTQRITCAIARRMADKIGADYKTYDFTPPDARGVAPEFEQNDLVVFGTPVYAGRVPNVLLPYLATMQGKGARAVPVVVYGNRHYDDALIELRDILAAGGFLPIAAGAFVGEHAFSNLLAKDRPDAQDMRIARQFAEDVLAKPETASGGETLFVEGTPYPYRGYFKPRDRNGNPVDIRTVKPLTNQNCNDCKLCADVCPMGSIDYENVREYTGICIKCGACVKQCPQRAKYYADEAYLYHKQELEEGFRRRAQPELFL